MLYNSLRMGHIAHDQQLYVAMFELFEQPTKEKGKRRQVRPANYYMPSLLKAFYKYYLLPGQVGELIGNELFLCQELRGERRVKKLTIC